MEGHAKKCVERYCELANKTTQQLYKVATPCMDDQQLKEEENESVGDCLQSAHKLFSNACIWLVLGDPVNKRARAVAKWARACDRRSARLISYSHHTEYLSQQMTLKPGPTSGRFKVTSFIVITMNLEFNSMCRRKKHSQFH